MESLFLSFRSETYSLRYWVIISVCMVFWLSACVQECRSSWNANSITRDFESQVERETVSEPELIEMGKVVTDGVEFLSNGNRSRDRFRIKYQPPGREFSPEAATYLTFSANDENYLVFGDVKADEKLWKWEQTQGKNQIVAYSTNRELLQSKVPAKTPNQPSLEGMTHEQIEELERARWWARFYDVFGELSFVIWFGMAALFCVVIAVDIWDDENNRQDDAASESELVEPIPR